MLNNNSYLHLSSDDLEFKDANIVFQQKSHQNLDVLTLHNTQSQIGTFFEFLTFHFLSRKTFKVCFKDSQFHKEDARDS